MKRICFILLAVAVVLASCNRGPSVIRTNTPPRPAGVQDMLGFAADPLARHQGSRGGIVAAIVSVLLLFDDKYFRR